MQLETGVISLKGTADLYYELTKVLGISLSCLLHDGFYSCLFLYSCMHRVAYVIFYFIIIIIIIIFRGQTHLAMKANFPGGPLLKY